MQWYSICNRIEADTIIFNTAVPMDDIYSPDGEFEVNFVYTTSYGPKNASDTTTTSESDSKDEDMSTSNIPKNDDEEMPKTVNNNKPEEDNVGSQSESSTDRSEKSEEETLSIFCDEVKDMFEENLFEKFKDIHTKLHSGNHHPLEITLKMKPIDSELWRLFCFPFLSRKSVEEDPGRKKEYYDLFEISRTYGARAFFQHFWGFADKVLEERGTMETTIVADVLVDTIEVFQVRDLTENKIIQGDGKERTVRHAVRMELDVGMVVDENDEHYYYQKNWRISDFDDLFGNHSWGPSSG